MSNLEIVFFYFIFSQMYRLLVSSENSPLVAACKMACRARLEISVDPKLETPELVFENSRIFFAGPILRFLGGDALCGDSASFRAEIDSWTTWVETEFLAFLKKDPGMGLTRLNNRIGAREFICGAKPSLADVAAFSQLAAAPPAPALLQEFANITRWQAACAAEFGAAPEEEGKVSKSGEKKRLKEEAKKAKEAERLASQVVSEGPTLSLREIDSHFFGNLFIQSEVKTDRQWSSIGQLTADLNSQKVWIRARVQKSIKQSSKLVFLTLRENLSTVQAVAFGPELAKFACTLTKESVVDILGCVTLPQEPVHSTSQKFVELQIEKLFCVSRAEALPLQMEDLSRTETEFAEAEGRGAPLVRVNLETRLNSRIIDIRTRANQAILRIQSGVCELFREFLLSQKFVEIHTPKLIATASEGGADVFKLNYFGGFGYLAQSPQLYKQMALMGDVHPGVFEIAPVFRAENSMTHRHMTEFIGLDIEMLIKEHYTEIIGMMDGVLNHVFTGLNSRFRAEIDSVREQYPFEDLQWSYPSTRFRFDEAVKLLVSEGPGLLRKDIAEAEAAGEFKRKEEIEAHLQSVLNHRENEDIGTSDEKLLGRVVKKSHNIDFYFIDKYPKEVRPFYTMPCPDDNKWTNSYDIFIRGEEITSGAQRIHDSKLLLEVAKSKNVDMAPIQDYVNSFKYGAHPHGGGGVGLERVVMLFLNLPNIRYASMFPRDPRRITP